MASRLLELRRGAGYATAKDFAEAMGIPPTTYTRYESSPEKIPLKAAWALADALGASIDEVVGRADGDGDPRGDVQRAFDALSPRSQEEVLDLIEVFSSRDERTRRDVAAEARRTWESIESRIDRAFLARLTDGPRVDGVLLTGTDAQIRERFEAFAREWVVGSEAPLNPYAPKVRDEEALAEVMAAYDRMHGTLDADGTTIQWAMEYDSGRRHGGKGGRGQA
jgi:transcriptional regulator with XRE-family HTH domain